MKQMRNVRLSFNNRFGWMIGLPYTAFFYMLLRGSEPWTFKNKTEDWLKTDSSWKVSVFRAVKSRVCLFHIKFCISVEYSHNHINYYFKNDIIYGSLFRRTFQNLMV